MFTLHVDEDGVITVESLQLASLKKLPISKKVVLKWNKEGQPIGKAAGLLGVFLGCIAANAEKLPIIYESWHLVPNKPNKIYVWDSIVKV